MNSLMFDRCGLKMYVLDEVAHVVHEYKMPNPYEYWNATFTCSYPSNYSDNSEVVKLM